ncbi:cob(I)yrinic acid a,c-diamide adenosyltransferase [Tepidibacillus marianensis]|uniref:cob(I)yrinic acid a,c-diamide adenosyltransferase n=1 Tax=Tepidibacillus marianensis TaxID=3131995 RepID=UPI0030D40CC2
MKIYTRSGDQGSTSLTGGERVEKNNPHVEAYGTVDEANSMIGLAVAKMGNEKGFEKVRRALYQIQKDLFCVGAELSTPNGQKVYWPLKMEQVTFLEESIDELEEDLPPLHQFILPGGSEVGAILHLSRTIIRRAERQSVHLKSELSSQDVITYLNRCSDFLFVAARWVNHLLENVEKSFIPDSQ